MVVQWIQYANVKLIELFGDLFLDVMYTYCKKLLICTRNNIFLMNEQVTNVKLTNFGLSSLLDNY